jgi:hypothetical protein
MDWEFIRVVDRQSKRMREIGIYGLVNAVVRAGERPPQLSEAALGRGSIMKRVDPRA